MEGNVYAVNDIQKLMAKSNKIDWINVDDDMKQLITKKTQFLMDTLKLGESLMMDLDMNFEELIAKQTENKTRKFGFYK